MLYSRETQSRMVDYSGRLHCLESLSWSYGISRVIQRSTFVLQTKYFYYFYWLRNICLSRSRFRIKGRNRDIEVDKGTAANPGRFAGDYEEWTDWDGLRAPPFRPSLPAISMRVSLPGVHDPRPGHPIPRRVHQREREREYSLSFSLVETHFEDTISKQITSARSRPIWLN